LRGIIGLTPGKREGLLCGFGPAYARSFRLAASGRSSPLTLGCVRAESATMLRCSGMPGLDPKPTFALPAAQMAAIPKAVIAGWSKGCRM